jgi:hypothetical protein
LKEMLTYQLPFFAFLEGWRSAGPERARAAAGHFPRDSVFRLAAEFLLDPNAPVGVESFRAKLPRESSWWADWMVAELCMKNRDHPAARAAYQKCLAAISDPLEHMLRQYIEAALYRLTSDPQYSLPPRERQREKEKP